MEQTSDANVSVLIAALHNQLERDPRLGDGGWLRRLHIGPQEDGAVLLEGEAERVAQKKIVLEHVAAHPDVLAIVDRLRVRPAEALRDAQIRSRLREVLVEDGALQGLTLREVTGDTAETVTELSKPFGELEYEVSDGVVTLNGNVNDLAVKRYVGVLVWWVPGVRDVINGIVAASEVTDGPDRLADAVRVVLEKDPSIDAGQVKVGVRGRVVHLTGVLASAAQHRIAEDDVWCIFGVDDVINDIELAEA